MTEIDDENRGDDEDSDDDSEKTLSLQSAEKEEGDGTVQNGRARTAEENFHWCVFGWGWECKMCKKEEEEAEENECKR